MKETKLSLGTMVLLGLAGLALLAPAVHAATITTQFGDLILGFQVTSGSEGQGATSNLEVDLGPITQLYGGTNVTLSALAVQDLVNTYGPDWATRSDLFWGAVATATVSGSLGFPANTLWATAPTDQVLTPGNSNAQGAGRVAISSMISGASAGKLNQKSSTTNSALAAVINNGLLGSWTVQDGFESGGSFSFFNPVVDILANPGSGQVMLDLYELEPNTAGQKLGTLVLTQQGLSFQAVPPPDTTPPTVSISSPANGTSYTSAQTVAINATASDDVGVSHVEFYDGATLKTNDTTAPYSYSWAFTSADNGTHAWTARAYDAAGNSATSAVVSLTVNISTADTTAPTVSISSPADGTSYTNAQTVAINATANDNVGVSHVEFYDGATLKTNDTTAPYSYSWMFTSTDNGTHAWTARAYDAAGNSATSAVVSLTVNISTADTTPPTVSISSPADGTNYTSAQTVAINATANDNVGVSHVEFYDGATLKTNDTTAPYSYSWAFTSTDNGTHVWTARAYDAAGNSATSAVVSLTVNISTADTTPPTVSISNPANGTSYTNTQTVAINATANDNVGVSHVEFYDGATLKTNDTTAPYSYSWMFTSADNGTNVWTARAYDAAGNVATSAVVNLTVAIDVTAPTVAISSPANGTSYTNAQTVAINATANDNVGVSRVEFYDGLVLKTTDTTAPYSSSWTFSGANNGTHAWTARAYDAAGNVATSVVVSLTVNITGVSSNHPPAFDLGPQVQNGVLSNDTLFVVLADSPAVFVTHATDPDAGDQVSYHWNFGDGAGANGALVSHTYTSCGAFHASVVATDGVLSNTAPLTVSVPCQFDANSPTKLQLKVNFAKTAQDTAKLDGTIDLGESFATADRVALVDIGGATLVFNLDSKGKGVSPNSPSTFQLKSKKKTSLWDAKAQFKKGAWREPWGNDGLTNAPIAKPGVAVKMPVILVVGEESFMDEPTLTYKCTKDKSGQAK